MTEQHDHPRRLGEAHAVTVSFETLRFRSARHQLRQHAPDHESH